MALSFALLSLLAALCLYLLRIYYQKGLNKYPGPFVAKFTDIWKVWYASGAADKQYYVDIHARYGDIVRVGPNELSFADPAAIDDITLPFEADGRRDSLRKSDSFAIFGQPNRGKIDDVLFTGTDPEWHDRQLRLLGPLLSTTNVRRYEPYIDSTIDAFLSQLIAQARQVTAVNMRDWFQYLSLDIGSELTFGERMGFIDGGHDVDGLIGRISGQMIPGLYVPSIDKYIFKGRLMMFASKVGWIESPNPFKGLVQRQFVEREQYWRDRKGFAEALDRPTLLDSMLKVQKENPSATDFNPNMHAMSMIGGGNDSVSATLTAAVYHIVKSPQVHNRLLAELSTLPPYSSAAPPFALVKDLPYLSACLNESMRLCPIDRIGVPRVTPPSGHTIAGHHISGNTVVSFSKHVMHQNKFVFGHDTEVFRPERWLPPECDESGRRVMERNLINFSKGKYSCIGKNLARVEIIKTLVALLDRFEIELVKPRAEEDPKMKNGLFAQMEEMQVKLTPRVLEEKQQ